MEYEENEAESRSGEDDLRIFKETCSEIRNLMREILDLKLSPETNDTVKKQIEEKALTCLRYAIMKAMNQHYF